MQGLGKFSVAGKGLCVIGVNDEGYRGLGVLQTCIRP